jgi:ElaB/YqjD/DUF883 family membrane-anchored ribosome-binding protein
MSAAQDRLEELRTRVEYSELELRTAFEDLQRVARYSLDPREWIRQRPLPWVGAACVVGFMLGARRR